MRGLGYILKLPMLLMAKLTPPVCSQKWFESMHVIRGRAIERWQLGKRPWKDRVVIFLCRHPGGVHSTKRATQTYLLEQTAELLAD